MQRNEEQEDTFYETLMNYLNGHGVCVLGILAALAVVAIFWTQIYPALDVLQNTLSQLAK